jgi:hypothetical protein
MQASGRPWQKELMFQVPRDHPEVLRLEGRYKKWVTDCVSLNCNVISHRTVHILIHNMIASRQLDEPMRYRFCIIYEPRAIPKNSKHALSI